MCTVWWTDHQRKQELWCEVAAREPAVILTNAGLTIYRVAGKVERWSLGTTLAANWKSDSGCLSQCFGSNPLWITNLIILNSGLNFSAELSPRGCLNLFSIQDSPPHPA